MLPQVKERWRLSERHVCWLLDVNRKMINYRCIKVDDPVLRARIKEIAGIRIRYGYERITALLRREGWKVNRKRVRRIYREENLAIRTKRPNAGDRRQCVKNASFQPRQTRLGQWTSCTTCSPMARRSGS